MKPTKLLIAGEIRLIKRQFNHPFLKYYGKAFYNKKFAKRLALLLKTEMPEHIITMNETDNDYILRIREQR